MDSLYGEIFVKGVPQGSYPLSRPSVSLFDLAAVSSSRPNTSSGWRAQERSRLGRHLAATDRLGLARLRARQHTCRGRDDEVEGSPGMVYECSCHILVCGGVRDPRP